MTPRPNERLDALTVEVFKSPIIADEPPNTQAAVLIYAAAQALAAHIASEQADIDYVYVYWTLLNDWTKEALTHRQPQQETPQETPDAH